VHVTFGDYTPRQRTVGYLESYLHGGVTTAISPPKCTCPAAARPEGVKRWRSRHSAASRITGRAG
jgi:enamidase